jgi:hypothetical protein
VFTVADLAQKWKKTEFAGATLPAQMLNPVIDVSLDAGASEEQRGSVYTDSYVIHLTGEKPRSTPRTLRLQPKSGKAEAVVVK